MLIQKEDCSRTEIAHSATAKMAPEACGGDKDVGQDDEDQRCDPGRHFPKAGETMRSVSLANLTVHRAVSQRVVVRHTQNMGWLSKV